MVLCLCASSSLSSLQIIHSCLTPCVSFRLVNSPFPSCRSCHQLDAGQVAAELLQHHQQVAARVQPRPRDMVPGFHKTRRARVQFAMRVLRCSAETGTEQYIPSLGDVAAVGLALGLAVRAGVAAAAAAAGGLVRPVPADVVAVHPHLALPHAAHVQGHRGVAGRRVEVGLMKKEQKKLTSSVNSVPISDTGVGRWKH